MHVEKSSKGIHEGSGERCYHKLFHSDLSEQTVESDVLPKAIRTQNPIMLH